MAPNIKRLSKQSRNTKSIFVFFVGLEKTETPFRNSLLLKSFNERKIGK